MLDNRPEEIQIAIKELEEAEAKITRSGSIEKYSRSLEELESYKEDYPEYAVLIDNLKNTYINRLIDLLYTRRPELDADSWVAIFSTIMLKNKTIFSEKLNSKSEIKEYFIHYFGLASEKTPPELEKIMHDLFM